MLCAISTLCLGHAARAEGNGGYPEPIVQWGVQPGETCADIAKAMYGSASHRALILRYNRVACTRGAPLRPGMTLVLPAKVTRIPTARITSVNPQTRARASGASWRTAQPGQPLASNSNINTLQKGRAAIQFRDRTRIYMASNTLVVIYDTASQSAVAKTRPPKVELEEGELQAGLAALRGDDTVEVAVKGGGRVSVNSRDAVVAKAGKRTTVSVFDGKARVKNAGATVKVPKNYGTRFIEKKAPEKPRPLPPAPNWQQGGSQVLVLAGKDGGQLTAAWSEVGRAVAYRFEVSRNAQFSDLVVRQQVTKDVRAFRAEKMPAGPYFLRVRAIDADDFLGISSAVRQLSIVPAKWTRGSGRFGTNKIEASKFASLELDQTNGFEMSFDNGGFGPIGKTLDLGRLQPKKLTFRRQGEKNSVAFPIRYEEINAQLEATIKDGTMLIEVAFKDLNGISPAELEPRARVVGPNGTSIVPLTMRPSDKKWIGSVAATPGDYTVSVVGVRGNVLGATALREDAPETPAAKPTPIAPPVPLIGPSLVPLGINYRTNVMWYAPTPHNQATVSTMLAARDGEIALQGQTHATGAIGPVGLEALIRTRTGTAFNQPGGTNAWLGARYRVLRIGRAEFELAPNLRLGVPLDDDGPPLRVEGGVALGGVSSDFSWLVNVGTRIRLADGDSPTRAYTDTASTMLLGGGTYQPIDWLRLSALLDGQLLFGEEFSYALGGNFGVELGTSVFGAFSVRGAYEPQTLVDVNNQFSADERQFTVAGQIGFGVRTR